MDPELTSVPPGKHTVATSLVVVWVTVICQGMLHTVSGAINYYPDMDDEEKPLLSSGESTASEGRGTPDKRSPSRSSPKGTS